jgi:succinate dehydrogenase / fumarate reductase cytochrome b subunit
MLSRLEAFFRSSIGKKALMAASGLLLIGFLLVHLAGNLTLFADRSGNAFAAYAEKLAGLGAIVLVAELGLLLLFVAHVGLGMRTALQNREARPERYKDLAPKGQRTWSSMTMIASGAFVLVFVVVHVLDFRLADFDLLGHPDPQALPRMVVERLASPVGALIYLVGVGVLGFHVWHGFQSLVQTLGLRHARYVGLVRGIGIALAVVIGLGFAAFPIVFVLLGDAWFKS